MDQFAHSAARHTNYPSTVFCILFVKYTVLLHIVLIWRSLCSGLAKILSCRGGGSPERVCTNFNSPFSVVDSRVPSSRCIKWHLDSFSHFSQYTLRTTHRKTTFWASYPWQSTPTVPLWLHNWFWETLVEFLDQPYTANTSFIVKIIKRAGLASWSKSTDCYGIPRRAVYMMKLDKIAGQASLIMSTLIKPA